MSGSRPKSLRRIRNRLAREQGMRCFYCGKAIVSRPRIERQQPDSVSLDHLVPVSRGGSHLPFNLVACCCACNTAKGNLTDQEFAQVRGSGPAIGPPARLLPWLQKHRGPPGLGATRPEPRAGGGRGAFRMHYLFDESAGA